MLTEKKKIQHEKADAAYGYVSQETPSVGVDGSIVLTAIAIRPFLELMKVSINKSHLYLKVENLVAIQMFCLKVP